MRQSLQRAPAVMLVVLALVTGAGLAGCGSNSTADRPRQTTETTETTVDNSPDVHAAPAEYSEETSQPTGVPGPDYLPEQTWPDEDGMSDSTE